MYSKVFFVRLQRDGLVDKNAWWKERWPKFRSQYSCKKPLLCTYLCPWCWKLRREALWTCMTVQLRVQWETLEGIRWIEQDTQYRPLDSSFPHAITYTQNAHTHSLHILTHKYTCKLFATDYISLNIAQAAMVHSIIKAGRYEIIFLSKTNTENKFIIMPLKYQHCIFSVISQKYTKLLVHQ